MRILLFDPDDIARESLVKATCTLTDKSEVWPFHSLPAATAQLHDHQTDFDLAIIGSDDGNQLLDAYHTLAATGSLPPTLIVSACSSVEIAVSLLKAGAENFIVRDVDGRWVKRLPDEAAAIANRSHAKRLRDRLDTDLRENQRRLAQIVDGSSVAMFVIDYRHHITHWNRACEALTGIASDDVVGTNQQWRAFYPKERPCMADLVLDGAMEARVAEYYGTKGYRRSSVLTGTYEAEDFFPNFGEAGCWLFFTAAPLKDSHGRVIGAIETLQDITEQKRAKEALNESETLLRQIVQCSSVATFVINQNHEVTHWNRACATLTGLTASEIIGTRQQWRAFYADERPCMADLVLDNAMEDKIAQYYGRKKYHRSLVAEGGFEAEDFFANFGNSGRWLYFTAAPLRGAHGEVIGAIETLQDITEQKRAEENLRQSEERYRVLSITDGMTGLYNARHFAQRLREEMDRCQRYRHTLALMVLDVDNFKRFNDAYGHVQGDQVLIHLAECINHCLRRTDQAFRYGGEEFVALLPETDLDEAEAAAERVRAMFANTEICPLPNQQVQCTASIGVTAFVPGESPRDFVARADSGTYEAKRLGKNRVIRITPKEPGDFQS